MSKLTKRSKGSPYKALPVFAAALAKAAPVILKAFGGGAAAAGGGSTAAAAGGKAVAAGGAKAAGGKAAAAGGKMNIAGMDVDPKQIMDLAQNFNKNKKEETSNSTESLNADGSTEKVMFGDLAQQTGDLPSFSNTKKNYKDIQLTVNESPMTYKKRKGGIDNSHRAA